MKRLKLLFYLTIAFILVVNLTSTFRSVSAEDKPKGYSEWSTEKTGVEGEITGTLYGYKEALSFSEEGSENIPADGFYNTTSKWRIIRYGGTVCSWRDIYGPDTGISCWEEGAGVTTYRYSSRSVSYEDSNTCGGVCSASEITYYYPVTEWSEEKGWRIDTPYEKTNTISPVSITVYSHPVTYHLTLDDGQVVNIKHGQTLPSVNVPSKSGYIFKGFYDQNGKEFYDSNGNTNIVYEEGMATDFIAKYEPIAYSINYLAENATGSTPTQSVKYDEYTNIKECGYKKSGYSFVYWQDDYGKRYSPGDTIINLLSVNNGVYNLHAVWSINEVGKNDSSSLNKDKDSSLTSKSAKSLNNNSNKKTDEDNNALDSDNYYLIKIPQELIIDNNTTQIDIEVKGNLSDSSKLSIELPSTLYLKSSDNTNYELTLNNTDSISGTNINETYKEISVDLSSSFDNKDIYSVSFPLTIQIEND